MAMMAAAFPILPGKTEEWRQWIGELNGPRHDAFARSRRDLGVNERTFLQSTPEGDIVIVTLEGDDPAAAFRRFAAADDEFSRWFLQHVRKFHGFDLNDVMAGPMPQQMLDSGTRMPAATATSR
jgi:hypothetical protein